MAGRGRGFHRLRHRTRRGAVAVRARAGDDRVHGGDPRLWRGRRVAPHLSGVGHGGGHPLFLLAHRQHAAPDQRSLEFRARPAALWRGALFDGDAGDQPLRRLRPDRPRRAAEVGAAGPAHRRHLHSHLQRRPRTAGDDGRRGHRYGLPEGQVHCLVARRRRQRRQMQSGQPQKGQGGQGAAHRTDGARGRTRRQIFDARQERARQSRQHEQRVQTIFGRTDRGVRRRSCAGARISQPDGRLFPRRPAPVLVPDAALLHQPRSA